MLPCHPFIRMHGGRAQGWTLAGGGKLPRQMDPYVNGHRLDVVAGAAGRAERTPKLRTGRQSRRAQSLHWNQQHVATRL